MGQHHVAWWLFVDEAGNFTDSTDRVVAAGMLIRADTPGSDPATIRRALQQAASDLWWPLHAALVNRPALHAISAHVEARAAAKLGRPPVRDDLAEAAVDFLASIYPAELAAAVETVAAHRRLHLDVVRPLDGALRSLRPSLHDALDDRVRAVWATVKREIERLGHANDDARAGAFCVCAVASGEAAFSTRPVTLSAEDATARYCALLETLLRRVVDLLSRSGHAHEVHLHVLTLDVWDACVGLKTPLHFRHIAPIASRAGTERVRLIPWEIPRFNRDVHPSLIFADFAANHARRALSSLAAPLDAVEADLSERLGVIVRSGHPPRSHLAATGAPSAYIEAASRLAAGVAATAPPSAHRRPDEAQWAWEQALEWCDTVGTA